MIFKKLVLDSPKQNAFSTLIDKSLFGLPDKPYSGISSVRAKMNYKITPNSKLTATFDESNMLISHIGSLNTTNYFLSGRSLIINSGLANYQLMILTSKYNK